tara:strand:- start:176 stop:502 length:327 start_codon:yes stop_codon:yes gene_type:complete
MAATCVSYYPSDLDTQRFWNNDHTEKEYAVEIPADFPKKIESPLAWTRDEVESKRCEWKLDLTSKEVAAIDAALLGFEGQLYQLFTYIILNDCNSQIRGLVRNLCIDI